MTPDVFGRAGWLLAFIEILHDSQYLFPSAPVCDVGQVIFV
jgi:hypothetical protein